MTHEVRHLLVLHGQSISMVPRKEMIRGGAAHRLEGLGRVISEINGFQQSITATETPDIDPNGLIEDVFFHMMEYADAVEKDGDRASRSLHVARLQSLLDQQEARARAVLIGASDPLPHVIVGAATKVRAGLRHDTLGVGVDSWSQRPWIWEARFWSADYQDEQADARTRRGAYNATGLRVPRPTMVTTQRDLERIRDWLLCSVH